MTGILRILTICTFIPTALAAENYVNAYLDQNQPDGWGPGIVIDQAKGVLHGEVTSLAVLYTYKIGSQGDRNHWQYLVVFESQQNEYTPTRRLLVGGGRTQLFSSVEISDRVIILVGKRHQEDEAMCCPSGTLTQKYVYLNGEIVARASEI